MESSPTQSEKGEVSKQKTEMTKEKDKNTEDTADTKETQQKGKWRGLRNKPRTEKGRLTESSIDEPDETKKILKNAKLKGSNISVATLDQYDPHQIRELDQMGHLTNLMAWVHLVKCSFGTGVLTMPKGFAHAGMIPGLLLGVIVGGFCIWCMQILIKSCVHIAARERQPYIPFNETMRYTFKFGYPTCQPISKVIKAFTDFVIVGYHFGICITYVNYLGQTSLEIAASGDHAEVYNWQTASSIFAWIPFLCVLNLIRNLKWLGPVSMAGNICTFISMGIILYYILSPDEKGNYLSGDWRLFGHVSTIPLYIGIILFAVEAFGVIIAVERDMKQPRKFLGWFGVFNCAMFLVVGWYLFLGTVGYMRYGVMVKSTISLTIPPSIASTIMKVLLAIALYCSYPLHLFVVFDSIWTQRIVPGMKNPERYAKLKYEYMFKFSLIILSGILAFAVPKLDLLVSLIGAVCLSFLGIMMPGIMEYNVAWSKHGNQWSLTMVKDVCIAVLGGFAFIFGTYGSLYGIINPKAEEDN